VVGYWGRQLNWNQRSPCSAEGSGIDSRRSSSSSGGRVMQRLDFMSGRLRKVLQRLAGKPVEVQERAAEMLEGLVERTFW
jgi:hypothetical protein